MAGSGRCYSLVPPPMVIGLMVAYVVLMALIIFFQPKGCPKSKPPPKSSECPIKPRCGQASRMGCAPTFNTGQGNNCSQQPGGSGNEPEGEERHGCGCKKKSAKGGGLFGFFKKKQSRGQSSGGPEIMGCNFETPCPPEAYAPIGAY